MKAKRVKRRYNTANEIRDDIDKYKAKAIRLTEQAEDEERYAKKFLEAGPDHKEDYAFCKEKAKKLRRSSARIVDKKLVYLKEKMAEWQTPPLPGTGIEGRDIQA